MRTITQRTTLPFLMAESGAASLTLAVITSPSPARKPRSPPRGKMQDSLRAPELSATSRIVRIPIIVATLLALSVQPSAVGFPAAGGRLVLGRSPIADRRQLNLPVQVLRRHGHLGRPPDHFRQLPPLQLA